MSCLWLDVEDLYRYAQAGHRRPGGIQRVAFEISRALRAEFGAQIRFVRHRADGWSFVVVPWHEVVACFDSLTAAAPAGDSPPPRSPARRRLAWLPPSVRQPLGRMAHGQLETLRALPALVAGLMGWTTAAWPRRSTARRGPAFEAPAFRAQPPGAQALRGPASGAWGRDASTFETEVRAGDTVLVLGSPFFRQDYAAFAEGLRRRHGVRIGLLVHDLIPIRRPEWCDAGMVAAFKGWMAAMLPACDALFALSSATAADVEAWVQARGATLRAPVRRIPAGTGFDGARTAVPERSARLPAPDSYVLLVATIEARKNHALLVRVWRRLIEQMPADQVPRLVFAGSVGWLVGDLLQQLDNANWLDGHVALVHEPSDAELAALYRDCLFTVFPSLYEGWGLPVTESLGFGKPCIIANATALPEAGGAFARGFDPENVAEATAVIRQVLDDRAGLAAWEARVRAEFRPVPWTAAAGAIAEAVGLGVGAQGAARHADSVAPDARDLAWDTDGFSSGAERFSPGPKS